MTTERDGRYRSGEHRVGEETQQLLAMRESQARAEGRQLVLMEQLVDEVKGLRSDLNKTSSELNEHKQNRMQQDGEVAVTLEGMRGSITNHTTQLGAIWDRFNQKQTAWAGVVPTIISSIASAILTSAVVGGLLYAVMKGHGP